MKKISFLNHKGGVGKTTLCTNISRAFLVKEENQKILLIDADPQGSLRDWKNALDKSHDVYRIDTIAADRKRMLETIPDVLKDSTYDFVFIDTPGDINDLHGAALYMSDLVIIPIRPSPYDIWASEDTIKLVRTAQQFNKNLKAAIVINQAIHNTKIHKEVTELLKSYDDFFIPETVIHHRVSFARTASLGLTVFDECHGAIDVAASCEISSLTFELIKHLNGGTDGS